MKKLLVILIIFIVAGMVNGQQIATVTPISKTIYKCSYGRPIILGTDASYMYVKGNCYNAKDHNIGVFDLKTFELTNIVHTAFTLKEKTDLVPYKLPAYSEAKAKPNTMLLTKLEGSKWGKDWHILAMSEGVKDDSGDSLYIEFGIKGSTFTDHFGQTRDVSEQYSVTSEVNLIYGVALTRYDKNGKLLWNTIFARGLFGGSFDAELNGAPLVVQKNNYIYVFYIDRSLNYSTQFFNEIRRGDTFEGFAMKYDLICQRINPADGTSEKFLIDSNPQNKGMYYLQDPVMLEDGSVAVMRTVKSYGTFSWYKLQIP